MYVLGVATIYLFVAFALLTLVAFALRELSLHFGPELAQTMNSNCAGLEWVSHVCLLCFLTVGTIRWNFGALAQLRRGRRARLLRPAPLPARAREMSQVPRGLPIRRYTVYAPPPFALQEPWSAHAPSVLRRIVRSYPVVGG